MAAQLISALETASANARLAEVARLAHILRGSSHQLGALLLVKHCAQLEQLAHEDDLAATAAVASNLRPLFNETLKAMRALIGLPSEAESV